MTRRQARKRPLGPHKPLRHGQTVLWQGNAWQVITHGPGMTVHLIRYPPEGGPGVMGTAPRAQLRPIGR